MSFSKAKILRFNEKPNEAPPPGAYSPKFGHKIRNCLIVEKKEKLFDNKSTTSSADNASVSSKAFSSASATKFRTPQIPKRRIVSKPNGMSCPRMRTKVNFDKENTDPRARYDQKSEIADLRVECQNKTATIKENEDLIKDLKSQIQDLKNQLQESETSQQQNEDNYRQDMESLAKMHQDVLDSKSLKHKEDMELLQTQLSALLREKEEEDTIRADLRRKISLLEEEIARLKDQEDIVEKIKDLQIATIRLDKMTADLQIALDHKDAEMRDALQLHASTQEKLSQAELRIEELQSLVNKLNEQNENRRNINQSLLEDMLSVVQTYCDFEQKLDYQKFPIDDPEVHSFLENAKKAIDDLRVCYEREMELCRDGFNEERETLEQLLEAERGMVTHLESRLCDAEDTEILLTRETHNIQLSHKELNRRLHETRQELDEANQKLADLAASHRTEIETLTNIHSEEQTKLKDLLEEARREYLKELENMTAARNEELLEIKAATEQKMEDEKKRIKECSNKLIENAESVAKETIRACRAESEDKVKKIIAENEAKISSLVREMKQSSENELRLLNEKHDACVERLEKEKVELNVTLAQKDLEVIRLTDALTELKHLAETQESFSQSLQAELDRAEVELSEKKEELRNLKDQIRTESAEMVARRRRFEVVMAENQASVAALTRRLAQSEAEVERLQRVLQSGELSIQEYKEFLDTLADNSKIVQDEVDTIEDLIADKMELIDKMENNNIVEINAVKAMLETKIENLRNIIIDELSRSQEECKAVTSENAELKQNLNEMSTRLEEAKNMLLKLEEMSDEHILEISKLELSNVKLQQEVEEKTKIIEENKRSHEQRSEEYKKEIEAINNQVLNLEEELKVLQEQNKGQQKNEEKRKDYVSTLLKDFEEEQHLRIKYEKQVKELEVAQVSLQKQYRDMSEKYADVVGNQTHKQRMKKVCQLEEKLNNQQVMTLQLQQELSSKNQLLEQLAKANEKLKIEDKRNFGKGKENLQTKTDQVSSPRKSLLTTTKSANTTPISSPQKSLTPLRSRND